MKISEMIRHLEDVRREHGDLECIYAKDDEGNGYSTIHYSPSAITVDGYDDVYGLDFGSNYSKMVCCVN